MARAQIYRGDPELKQVVLFDNFSGGMNTTDIDEQMGANEFRYLENVELMEQGRVAKRTGFKNLDIKTEFGSGIPLGFGDIYHINVLTDKYNNFDIYNYEKFKTNEVEHNIIMVCVWHNDDGEAISIDTIELKGEINNGKYEISVVSKDRGDIAYLQGDEIIKKPKMTGIDVNYYDGAAYFMLNQILEGSEDIIKYELKEDKLEVEIFNKTNSYRPTPFELTNVGFNTFSNSPHSHTSSAQTSVESIQSVIIIDNDDDNLVLSKVPLSGKFKLRVYYTGRDTLRNELRVKFYVHNTDEAEGKEYLQASVELNSSENNKGTIDYDVTLNTTRNDEVYIEIKKTINSETPDVDKFNFFASKDDMVNHFKSSGKFMIEEVIPRYYTILEGDSSTPYSYSKAKMRAKIMSNGIQTGYYEQEMSNIPLNIFLDGGLEYIDWVYGKYADDDLSLILKNKAVEKDMEGNTVAIRDGFPLLYTHESGFESVGVKEGGKYIAVGETLKPGNNKVYRTRLRETEFTELPEFFNSYPEDVKDSMFSELPTHYFKVNQNKILAVHDDEAEFEPDATTYYRYNGGTTGTIDDFTNMEWTTSEDIINFTVRYNIGTSTDKPIEPIKFDKLRSIIIKDRLVLYGGNTVVYSDTHNRQKDTLENIQGFTYFPNYNWFSLALGANDSIQKIAYFRGSYMIFTKTSIYRMSGDFHTDEFTVTMVSDVVGCVSPDSIRSMNNTLIFLSEDGLYTLKQNYYLDGMENVGKIDSNIQGVIPYGENYESLIHNEQYWLLIKDREGNLIKVLKQYYNLDLPKGQHPYTIDTYNKDRFYLFRAGINLYGVEDNQMFRKGKGYEDFKPIEYNLEDYSYPIKIETPYWSFGYPLHEKKFKNVFLKVNSVRELPVMFDIFVDFGAAISSDHFSTRVNYLGEVEYIFERRPSLITQGVGELGSMNLGKDVLGDAVYQVHKINPATKGKTIKFVFEQGSASEFSVDAISIVYKLGKMRESR